MEAFHGTAEIVIDGEHLTLEDVYAVARQGAKVRLSPDCFEQIDRSRALVEKFWRRGAVSTAFPPDSGNFPRSPSDGNRAVSCRKT